jgi:hypothetical protein
LLCQKAASIFGERELIKNKQMSCYIYEGTFEKRIHMESQKKKKKKKGVEVNNMLEEIIGLKELISM